jgi:tetratricopeptide (TPR) repeat protein
MDSVDDVIDAAWRARRDGRHQEAERGLRDAIDASLRPGDERRLVSALGKLAHVLRDLGRHDEALPLSEEAVRASQAAGDPMLLAHTVRHLGDLHREAERLSEAEHCYDEALTLYRAAASPDALDFANALRPAALLKVSQGQMPQARALLSEARALYEKAGTDAGVDECARHLAQLE